MTNVHPSNIPQISTEPVEVRQTFVKIGSKRFVVKIGGKRIEDKAKLEEVAALLQQDASKITSQYGKNTRIRISQEKGIQVKIGASKAKAIQASHRILGSSPIVLYEVQTPIFENLALRIKVLAANCFAKLDLVLKPLFTALIKLEGKQAFRSYFNYSWKSQTTDMRLLKIEEKMSKHYHGQFHLYALQRGVQSATEFQKQSKSEIKAIIDHRRILLELGKKMEFSSINAQTKEVQARIDALSDSDSPDVVHAPNYTSFTIPGGCIGHLMTYEFQRDNLGQYFFVIHNRGSGGSIKNVHGPSIEIGNSIYTRTSVKIEVTKEQISDPQFLKSLLVQKNSAHSMKSPYKVISKFLSVGDPPELKIVKSDLEKSFLETIKQARTLNQKIKAATDPIQQESLQREKNLLRLQYDKQVFELVQNDPAYHSAQLFGTCTESNLTGPEKALASATVRRELKLFTIDSLAYEVANKRTFLFRQQKRVVAHHHQVRRAALLRSR